MRALLGELERIGGRPIGSIALRDVQIDQIPHWDENDAGRLLNLLHATPVDSPHASFESALTGEPARVLFTGTSFSWGPLRVLSGQRFLRWARLYYYFNSTYQYEPGAVDPLPQPVLAPDDFATSLAHIEFVVLEANEEWLESPHVGKFIQAVDALAEPPPDPSEPAISRETPERPGR